MTGYEKSPDYGGRPATWKTWLGLALFFTATGLVAVYLAVWA